MGKHYLKWDELEGDFSSYQKKQIAEGLKRFAENNERIYSESGGVHTLAQLTPENINRIVRDEFKGDAQKAWEQVIKPVLKDQQKDVKDFDRLGQTSSDKEYAAREREAHEFTVISTDALDCRVALATADGMDHRYGRDGVKYLKNFIDTHPTIFGNEGASFGKYDYNDLFAMVEDAADMLELEAE